MDGLMGAERSSREGQLLPAGGDADWAGLSAAPSPRRRAWRLAWPLSSAVVATLVALLDMLATAAGGLALQAVPLRRGPPSMELIGFVTLLVPCIAAAAGAYGYAWLFGGRRGSLAALLGLTIAVGGMTVAAAVLGAGNAFRLVMAVLWLAAAAPLMLAGRLGAACFLRAMAGRARQRAVLVGDGPQASR